MATTWNIAGEAGKTVDESLHPLAALQAEGAVLEFNSLDSDRLTWNVWLAKPTEAGVLVPDLGQRITLFRDGVRQFTGNVTGRRIRFDGTNQRAEITVEGPWWWLKQIPLSSEIPDQTTEESERTAFIFPTESVRTSLIALIARAISLGAPISQGPIASCFAIPRLSLRNIPFSEAVAELMRWIADGIVYFDYSVPGDPALCMQRREAAGVVTLNPTSIVIGDIDLNPRLNLQVEELKVFYAKRETVDNKRLTTWQSETAGEVTSGLPRRQPALISGPEIDTYLPQDFTDSVVVRSAQAIQYGFIRPEVLAKYDDRLKALPGSSFGVANGQPVAFGVANDWSVPMVHTITTDDGEPIPNDYPYYLTNGETKDWWTKDGIEFINARVTATIYTTAERGLYDEQAAAPAWFQVIGGQVFSGLLTGSLPYRRIDVWYVNLQVTVPFVKTLWPVDTTLIRAEDYAFINPPEGLAENLLSTQNWLPYQGTVGPVAVDDLPSGHPLGAVMNVSGFLPETANMRALISGCTKQLRTGTITYKLGSPDRFAYRDLVNRFRQSGADNIVFLVDSVSGDAGENPEPDPELEIPSDLPDQRLAFDAGPLTLDGAYLTFTPAAADNALAFGGDELSYDSNSITFT